MRAELLFAAGDALGEGPVQLVSGALVWVDIMRGEIHRLDASRREHDVTVLGEPVGAVAETLDGGIIAACRSGLRLVGDGPESSSPLVAPLPPGDPDIRMNDGKADPAGRFVGGTTTLDPPRPHAASLWSFRSDGPVRLVGGVTISNGLAWSADGSTLYYIDTPTRRIDAFDYDVATGNIEERRPVVEVPPEHGDPDGMCIDVDGGLWVAMWGGGAVRRYVGGVLDDVVEVPTPFVTCPAFAGPQLDELVITTASSPFTEPAPGAGDVYIVRPGVGGPAPFRVDMRHIRPGRS